MVMYGRDGYYAWTSNVARCELWMNNGKYLAYEMDNVCISKDADRVERRTSHCGSKPRKRGDNDDWKALDHRLLQGGIRDCLPGAEVTIMMSSET